MPDRSKKITPRSLKGWLNKKLIETQTTNKVTYNTTAFVKIYLILTSENTKSVNCKPYHFENEYTHGAYLEY